MSEGPARRVWKSAVFLAGLSLPLSRSPAQDSTRAVATSALSLRSLPSANARRKTTIDAGDTLRLLTGQSRNDYVRVVSPQSDTGWVWRHRLRFIGTPAPVVGAVESPALSTSSGGDPASWEKPQPVELLTGICPAAGKGQTRVDSATNLRKNRIDIPSSYHALRFDQILQFPDQGLPTRRWKWSQANSAMVANYDGAAVSMEGYLADAVEEQQEATNCGGTSHDWHDWHVWLVETPAEATNKDKRRAVVVEVTPRVRAIPITWQLADLHAAHAADGRVRISGWLLLDPDHPTNIGSSRGTIWEIHPVARIEVQRNGSWVDLASH
jgi:Bacterial SH3 domain